MLVFPIKNGDFPIKNGDFPIKHGDFPSFFVCLPEGSSYLTSQLTQQGLSARATDSQHLLKRLGGHGDDQPPEW